MKLDMNIRTKLIGGFLIVTALLLAVFGVAYNGLNSIDAATDHIVYEELPEIKATEEIALLVAEQEAYYYEYALTLDEEALIHAGAIPAKIETHVAELEHLLAGETAMLEELADFNTEYEEFVRTGEEMGVDYAEGHVEAGMELAHLLDTEVAQMEEDLHRLLEEMDLAVEAAIEGAHGAHNSAVTMTMVIAIVAAVVAIGLGFFSSQRISTGVNTVAGAMRKIAIGDLTQKVDVKSSDEIGDMARSYGEMQTYLQEMAVAADNLAQGNLAVAVAPKSEQDTLGNSFSQMVASLRNLIGQVRDTAGNVASSSQQLNRAAEESGKATGEIASSSQQVAKGADDQSRSIQDVTASVGQLNQASQQVAQGAQEQANLVQQATDIVNQVSTAITQVSEAAQSATQGAQEAGTLSEQGAQQAQRTIEGINRVKESSLQVAGQIEEMNSLSAEIGKVVAVIDDIASQTNLLALNATIEAARAGEHGKGFAVVAEEVRQLAERVAVSTKEIEATIEKMQKAAEESVSVVNAGTEDVDNGIKLADEAGNALAEILGKAQDVGQQVEHISAAAEQMNASSTEMVNAIEGISRVVEQNTAGAEEMTATGVEVGKAIEGVAGVSEENSAASQQVSASAQQMSAQVEEVVASAQSLNEMAENLNNLVAAFKLDERDEQVGINSKPESFDGQDA